MRKAFFVLLALGGMVSLGQTPSASKAPKAGEPVFADFGTSSPSTGGSSAPTGTTGDQKADVKKLKVEDKGRGAASDRKIEVPGATNVTTAVAGTNAAAGPISLSGYVPDDKYKLRVGG